MEKSIKKVAPTPELLQEMEELEVLGGTASGDNNTYALSNCKPVYNLNCVPQCACHPEKEEPDKDDPSRP